jgi:organic radical activating enzyme
VYIQITTKCNMRCAHCCYSCNGHGRHMDFHLALDAMRMANEYGEFVTLGGGEPTLHPRFFDILRRALWASEGGVWMATNGSKTKVMRRLSHILDDCDWEDFDENSEEPISNPEGRLTVALSQDQYHDPIDDWVVEHWKRRAGQNNSWSKHNGFSINQNRPFGQRTCQCWTGQ